MFASKNQKAVFVSFTILTVAKNEMLMGARGRGN